MNNFCPWDQFEKVPYQYCEELLCSWVTQPANTASNVFYLITGLAILAHSKKHEQVFSPFGYMAIFVGICSTFFHMSFAHWGGMADLFSMKIIAAFLLSHNLKLEQRIKSIKKSVLLILLICMIPSHFLTKHWHYLAGGHIFTILFIVTLISEFLKIKRNPQIKSRELFKAIIIFGIGYLFLIIDNSGKMCDPTNHYIQMHVFWHLFTAISIFFIYTYHSTNQKLKGR